MNIWEYDFDYNGHAILFDLFLLILALCKYRGVYAGKMTTSNNYLLVFLLLVVYATFAYGEADFYHYQFHYDMMKHYGIKSLSESVYLWIAQTLPDNYYIWRFSVWASAALLMILSLKNVKVNANCAGLMLPLYFWVQFSVTRGALGFAIIIFSLTFVFGSENKKRIIVILMVLLSVFFHNSMAAFLLLLPVAFILPLNSKIIKLSLLGFPILYFAIMMAAQYLLDINILENGAEMLAEKYMERADEKLNIGGIAFDALHFSGQLLMLYLAAKYVIGHKAKMNKAIVVLFKYGYILIYISFLFYGQSTSSFISSRFLHASTFPLVVVYSYYMSNHRVNKTDRIALFLLGTYAFYKLLYPMYKWW